MQIIRNIISNLFGIIFLLDAKTHEYFSNEMRKIRMRL